MRIAGTDYDGTLLRNGVVADRDLDAIRVWRGMGHVFGLVTGRDLSMMRPEFTKWGLCFDFLVCCSGAVVHDQHGRVLASSLVQDHLVADVLGHPSAQASMHYELCRDGQVFLYLRDPYSWFPGLGSEYVPVGPEQAATLTGLQQISLAYWTPEEGRRHAEALERDFGGRLAVHHNGPCVDLTAFWVDKASGVSSLLALKGWAGEDVLFIGDGQNDIPMMRQFTGYTVPGAPPEVMRAAVGVHHGVGAMLMAAMAEIGRQAR